MYILAFETTGPHCSVAILDQEGIVRAKASKGTMNHLQFLMPLTRELLGECKLQLGDISAIAVSAGPGSFTGIRIGVSSARGLAQALNCKIIPVPTLKAFAYHAPSYKGLICPIFDARRNQVYGGAYLWEDNQIVEVVPAGPYMLPAYLTLVDGAIEKTGLKAARFFGDGLKPYGEMVLEWGREKSIQLTFAPEEHRYQEASSVAYLGYEEMKKGNLLDYSKVFPNYMRMAEAQRNLEERLAREQAQKNVGESEVRHE